MPVISYPRALALHAERDPERIAIVHEDREIGRAALDRSSNRLARAYAGLGVRRGDLVAIALPNCIEFFEAAFAAWKLGAVPLPISSKLPETERTALLELAGPVLITGIAPLERT